MISYPLDGVWELAFGPQPDTPLTKPPIDRDDWHQMEVRVPGNVEISMQDERVIQDPMIGRRVYRLREYERCQWWYRRFFNSPNVEAGQRVQLVFSGIDTVATVFLNDREVGRADNMLVPHRFDITSMLGDSQQNYLAVRIDSAALEGRRHVPDVMQVASDMTWEYLPVRKAAHGYGCDFMPRLLSAGLWRGVRLEIVNPTRWRSVYCATMKTDVARRTAQVLLDWDLATEHHDLDDLKIRILIEREGGVLYKSELPVLGTHGRRKLDLEDVDFWWPLGSGHPVLYDLNLELVAPDGSVIDTYTQRLGIRTVKLERTETTTPEQPGEFIFRVNGEKVFVKGTNWGPLDALHGRDAKHIKSTLDLAVDLNCNMLRCWGGGVYESKAFFDYCDEHGLLVWQDFAFVDAVYPQTDSFATLVTREAETIVRQLRNHACMALWAGNNGGDQAFVSPSSGVGIDPNLDRISRDILPGVVRRLDPIRDYLPSSPYCSPALLTENMRPEDHLWGARDDFKGVYYTNTAAHFISEIGAQGCPRRESLERMFDPAHLWPYEGNEQWLTKTGRQHPGDTSDVYRLDLLAKQIKILFPRVPRELDEFVLASQIAQAEALKFFIERSRVAKWTRTGILWWHLRDGWPLISDSVVDYYFGRKLAYSYIKRVQTDVAVMCAEATTGSHPVIGVNGTREPREVRLVVRDAEFDAKVLEAEGEIPPNDKATLGTVPHCRAPACYLMEWTVGDTTYRNHYIAGPRPWDFGRYREWMRKMGLADEFIKLLV